MSEMVQEYPQVVGLQTLQMAELQVVGLTMETQWKVEPVLPPVGVLVP